MSIHSAVEQLGLPRLAAACGVKYQAVQRWVRQGQVPADRCVDVERATGGAVSCERLRPDLGWNRDADGRVTGYTTPIPAPPADQQKAAA